MGFTPFTMILHRKGQLILYELKSEKKTDERFTHGVKLKTKLS